MKRIGLYNEQFFYMMCGTKPAVANFIYTMRDEVDSGLLEQALRDVIRRFHYLRLKPQVDADGKLCFVENETAPKVWPEDGSIRRLGTEETGGYLFRVICGGKSIRLSVFHGLADGRGISCFGLSLITRYLILTGVDIDPGDMVITPQTPVDPSETEEYFSRCREFSENLWDADGKYMPHDVFVIPEERQYYDSDESRRFELVWRAKPFMDFCRRLGGTPVTVMSAVIGTAACRLYEVGKDVITINVPVDIRELLKSRAQANCTVNVSLPYPDDYRKLSLSDQVRNLRASLINELKPANLMSGMDDVQAFLKKLTEIRLDDREALASLHSELKVATKANTTLMLTNIGLIRMPVGMEEYVTDFEPVAVNIEYSPAFCMITIGQTGRLLVSQNYDDTKLLEEIAGILRENGVEAGLVDCGMIMVDTVEPYLFEKSCD